MRPEKFRTVGHVPACRVFLPQMDNGDAIEDGIVRIGLDMLEAMRLVDLEGLSQEIAAKSMGVSTPTLCRILAQGRKLAALALTSGKTIILEGGNIMFGNANQNRNGCCRGHGHRHCYAAFPTGNENCSRDEAKENRQGCGKGRQHRGQGRCARHVESGETSASDVQEIEA